MINRMADTINRLTQIADRHFDGRFSIERFGDDTWIVTLGPSDQGEVIYSGSFEVLASPTLTQAAEQAMRKVELAESKTSALLRTIGGGQ